MHCDSEKIFNIILIRKKNTWTKLIKRYLVNVLNYNCYLSVGDLFDLIKTVLPNHSLILGTLLYRSYFFTIVFVVYYYLRISNSQLKS